MLPVETGAYCRSALTTSDTAPGPGRSAAPSISPLPVAGMQNTAPRVILTGGPRVRLPPATPFSVMLVTPGSPNAPAVAWEGQNIPPPSAMFAAPVVSGFRLTGNGVRIGPEAMQSCERPVDESGWHVAPGLKAVASHVPPTQNGQGCAAFPEK